MGIFVISASRVADDWSATVVDLDALRLEEPSVGGEDLR